MEGEWASGQEGRKERRKGGRKEGRLVCDIQAPHAREKTYNIHADMQAPKTYNIHTDIQAPHASRARQSTRAYGCYGAIVGISSGLAQA